MTRYFKSCFLIIACLLILSCKKNNQSPVAENNTYQPTTKGSYWKYNQVSPTLAATETVTMTGATNVFNSRLYYEYESVFATSNSSARATGYFYEKDGVVMSATLHGPESIFLKANAVVGETWVYMGPASDQANGINISEPYSVVAEVVAKEINYSVAGKTFKDVIHLKFKKRADSGTTTPMYDCYVAKGVGLIERISADGKTTSQLVEYSIK